MANQEQLESLKQGVEVWNSWPDPCGQGIGHTSRSLARGSDVLQKREYDENS
jgi:hypothetical protein